MGPTLREVRDEDLPLLFEQWADPVAVHMAAFTAPDHMDWDAFERRWSRLRADETVLTRVIVVGDDLAGTIGSWGDSGEREVTYDVNGRGVSDVAIPELSAVEQQIVLLVAQGRRAIADELGRSLKTVDWHVARGRRKLERAAALHQRMQREADPIVEAFGLQASVAADNQGRKR